MLSSSRITFKNLLFVFLGILSGSQIEIANGFYLSHLVIIVLFFLCRDFNKTDVKLYVCFILLCTFGTLLNIFYSPSISEFRATNFFNSIFLYSVILLKFNKAQFTDFFKGVLLSYCGLVLIVLLNFRTSIFSNGILLFFVNGRDWAENLGFFGNSFAIYSIVLGYICYKLFSTPLLVFAFIVVIALLTTSRLSLFGVILLANFLFGSFKKSTKIIFILVLIGFGLYIFYSINFSEMEGFSVFSNRLEYVDDRANLSDIAKILFMRSPWFGNGPIYIEKYTKWEPHLHSIWFDIAVGYGLSSLIFYLIIFTRTLKDFYSQTKDYLFIFFILIASYAQISLKESYIGLLLFMYLNLYKQNGNSIFKIKNSQE